VPNGQQGSRFAGLIRDLFRSAGIEAELTLAAEASPTGGGTAVGL